MNDLKFAIGRLLKSPGSTAVAVLTLALGIGANTAVFSVLRGVLLRPLPYENPEQLVQIDMFNAERSLTAKGTSFLNFEDWRKQNDVFQEMAAVQDTTFNLTGDGEPERIHGWRVSSGFFSLMGVRPIQGRAFGSESKTSENVALVSEGLWQRRFGAQTDVLGKRLTLDGQNYAVIGVMPASFTLPGDATELWLPLRPALKELPRGQQFLFTLARLKPGVDVNQAQSAMDVIARRLAQQFPNDNAGWGVQLHPFHNAVAGSMRPVLLILFGCVGLVLLVVCLNVGSLVLAMGAARGREMAIRVALGASRFRVMRLCLIESLVLSFLGGAVGLLVAMWGLRLLQAIPPSSDAPTLLGGMRTVPSDATQVDWAAMVFLLLTSVVAGVVFGVFPALRAARLNPNQALKAGTTGADRSRGGRDHFRDGLVVAQVAVATVLLVGAGLLTGSLTRLMQVDPGFRSDSALYAEMALSPSRYPEESQVTAFWDQLCEKVAALPGVVSAGVANSPPFAINFMTGFTIEGQPPKNPGQFDVAMYRTATPGYFQALGIPLLRGRVIASSDRFDAPAVVVIDNEMAQRFWPGEDPLGARINVSGRVRTVVGIVGAVKHYGLDADLSPTLYLPQMQEPNTRAMTVVVRTTGNPPGMTAVIRGAVKTIDPDQPVARIRSMDSVISGSLMGRRLMASGLGSFAVLALVLVAIGLYGVVSLSVARRTREIGIRMALGARRRQVLSLVIRQGMWLALAGLGIGAVAALALSRVMASVLYEIKPTDPFTFASVSCLLVSVACLACWLPARRAAKVDPITALRTE